MIAAWPDLAEGRSPALFAALVLHIGLFLILTLAARPSFTPMGAAVPINIVASGPITDSRAAVAALTAQTAQVETPTAAASPPVPPPAAARPPAPAASTPQAVSKPAPTPRPLPAKPEPSVRPARPDLNLDALASSIARTTRPSPPRPAFARRGPAAAETALQTRIDAGQGVSQSDIAGLSQLLERLWNPNCVVEAGDAVIVPVRFNIGDDGRLVGRVTGGGRETSSDPIVFAAARRAIDAVRQAEPYGAVYRGKSFTVNFDAKTACSTH